MYELIQAAERTFYVQSPAKVGLVLVNEKEAVLIDSGSDKDAGRKVYRHLEANGWTLRAIYNTHSHADHIGGCAYLQRQTGCKVYAPGIECAFTRHPVLEPAFLYGGLPVGELRRKFLLAQESDAQYLTDDVLPEGFQAIPLPGHTFDMVGYRTPDGVVFLADCLSSRETLEKYRVGFLYDVGACLETLERVRSMEAALFVPAHAEAAEDIAPLAEYNMAAVRQTADDILSLCARPLCFEEVLQGLFRQYGLTMNFEQYALVGSTVRSYLAWLKETGRAEARFEDGMLRWCAV